MQKFFSLTLSFLFLFHSTAFSYQFNSQKKQDLLNNFSLELVQGESQKQSQQQFQKIKKKLMKGLKKEIRKNKKLSVAEQDQRWQKKLAKRFKQARKNLPRFMKNKNMQNQMQKKNVSYHTIAKKFSKAEEKKVIQEIKEQVSYYKNYVTYLRAQLEELKKSKYEAIAIDSKKKSNYRSIAQFDGAFWQYFGILLLIIVPIAVVLLIISLSVILATGGLGTPLVISWIVVLAGAAFCGLGMLSDT
ncbi:hypothetical protein N9N67_05075 [Bacteriovoracaceae bacterium]|nr:hypothetical protein [Bacteriovoracaceae bacterium]